MPDDKPIAVHIDGSEKAKHLPEYREDLPCATCGGATVTGFGLAGGGMGIYSYCESCGVVVSKSITDE